MKKFLALLFAVVCLVSMCACGAHGPDDGNNGDAESGSLTIWTTGGPLRDTYEELAQDGHADGLTTKFIMDSFHEKYPDTKITLIEMGWGVDLNKALRDAFIVNKMPDIVCGEQFIKTQIKQNYFQKLEVPEETKNAISSTFWDCVSDEEGNIYGYPYFTGDFVFMYNERLLKEAGVIKDDGSGVPSTMVEVQNAAAKVYNHFNKKVGGFAVSAIPSVSSAYRNVMLMQMFGGGFYDENENLIINSKESVEAMKWVQGVTAYAYPGNIAFNDETQISKMIWNDQVAMAIELSNALYVDEGDGIDMSDWKTAPLPTVSGVDETTNLLISNVSYMVTKSCKNVALAQNFLEYLVSEEVQNKIYLQSSYRLPVREDVILELMTSTEPEVVERNKILLPAIDSILTADNLVGGLPSFGSNYANIWNSWTSTIQNIITGKDPQEYLNNFAKAVNDGGGLQ